MLKAVGPGPVICDDVARLQYVTECREPTSQLREHLIPVRKSFHDQVQRLHFSVQNEFDCLLLSVTFVFKWAAIEQSTRSFHYMKAFLAGTLHQGCLKDGKSEGALNFSACVNTVNPSLNPSRRVKHCWFLPRETFFEP